MKNKVMYNTYFGKHNTSIGTNDYVDITTFSYQIGIFLSTYCEDYIECKVPAGAHIYSIGVSEIGKANKYNLNEFRQVDLGAESNEIKQIMDTGIMQICSDNQAFNWDYVVTNDALITNIPRQPLGEEGYHDILIQEYPNEGTVTSKILTPTLTDHLGNKDQIIVIIIPGSWNKFSATTNRDFIIKYYSTWNSKWGYDAIYPTFYWLVS